jgi:hypothetical protein
VTDEVKSKVSALLEAAKDELPGVGVIIVAVNAKNSHDVEVHSNLLTLADISEVLRYASASLTDDAKPAGVTVKVT